MVSRQSQCSLSLAIVDPESIETLTSQQIATLRKEANRRSARNQLPWIVLDADESMGPWSDSTIKEILNQLAQHELVQVRGLCRDDRRYVKSTAERLSAELSVQAGDLVSLVDHAGHAAVLYQPSALVARPISLHTTGKENHWQRRAKAPRDRRGQIIKD